MTQKTKIKGMYAIMGSGKTNMIIAILRKNPNTKIIFVTEYIDEIERIQKAVPSTIFQPSVKSGRGKKKTHLTALLEAGVNIATTHKLFSTLKPSDYHLLEDYTMILDEVLSVIEKVPIPKDSIEAIIAYDAISVDKDMRVFAIKKNYQGASKEVVKRIDTDEGDIFLFEDHLIWMVNPQLFLSFKQILITTYYFEGSYLYSYFLYHKIAFKISNIISAGRYRPSQYINLYEGVYNKAGVKRKGTKHRALSSSFYKNATEAQFKKISNSTYKFFKTYCKTLANENGYAIFKDADEKLTKDGFGTSIPVNARATNKYGHIKNMAYLVEMNPDPIIVKFLNKGLVNQFNADDWRLSVLIQWVFRGSIRNVNPQIKNGSTKMNLLVLSNTMRILFKKWLKKH